MAESRLILGARRCRKDKGTRDLEQIMSFCPSLIIKLGDQESDLI